MKRIICFMLALVCLACVTSCGKTTDENYIDLTTMNDTMIQTNMGNMSRFPEAFGGKTVKMKGFIAGNEELTELYCVYIDPTGCCTRLMTVKWAEGYTTPGSTETITIEGTYDASYTGVETDYICGRLLDVKILEE